MREIRKAFGNPLSPESRCLYFSSFFDTAFRSTISPSTAENTLTLGIVPSLTIVESGPFIGRSTISPMISSVEAGTVVSDSVTDAFTRPRFLAKLDGSRVAVQKLYLIRDILI